MKNLSPLQMAIISIGSFIILVFIFLLTGALSFINPIINGGNSPIIKSVTTQKPTAATQLANPASVNCTKQGGTLVIKARGDGGEYGLCQFQDNMACEEWALMRGQCPVNGLKTTGYDNIEEKYCAWLGGKTFAAPNATCTLPSGKVCSDKDLYNGLCQ